ncbi:hypothetical protein K8S17_03740, partial [bacterium]|nr:hypothetical protein [bacterium]
MSNLGVHAVLRAFLGVPGVRCERAFWPAATSCIDADGFAGVEPESDPGAGELLSGLVEGGNRSSSTSVRSRFPEGAGRSLESDAPLFDFDVVAFSVSFEGDYFNLVRLLAAGGVPVLACERGEDAPL